MKESISPTYGQLSTYLRLAPPIGFYLQFQFPLPERHTALFCVSFCNLKRFRDQFSSAPRSRWLCCVYRVSFPPIGPSTPVPTECSLLFFFSFSCLCASVFFFSHVLCFFFWGHFPKSHFLYLIVSSLVEFLQHYDNSSEKHCSDEYLI